MGDSYDEDEDRLMIDDAIHESTHSTQTGVESHPVDPEPKPNFYCEGAVSKVVQSVHRNDRLKMTIRRTQSPVGNSGQFSYLGEKLDSEQMNEDICKEEGEIDDEEEVNNSMHMQSAISNVHHSANWPAYQDASVEGASTNKFRQGSQQQFEHHNLYKTQHACTRQLAVSTAISSDLTSHGKSVILFIHDMVNAIGSVVVEDHNSYSFLASDLSQTELTSISEEQSSEGLVSFGQKESAAEDNDSKSTGYCATLNIANNKSRKKKRRISERDERETCQASSNMGSSLSTQITPVNIGSTKKKKSNMRDRSTCVGVKSVQTSDSDVDVKIGSSHCLNISVLSRASNYLYFVTNWNGHELYGILGDGLPPMQHSYMVKKNFGTSVPSSSVTALDLFGCHDKTNGGSSSKARNNTKRSNRSSSVCPPNGFPEIKQPGRKGLIGSVGRSSSASTSDIQSVGGDLPDEERSQSPVSWFTTRGNDPISALGTDRDDGLTQLRECSTAAMYLCPVAGCEHRYDTQSQLAIHYHTHFVKENSGRAIYVETMGTQTDSVITKNVAVNTVDEINQMDAVSLKGSFTELKNCRSDDTIPHIISPRKSTKTLTNHEEQSISELFKVVTQKAETSTSSAKIENKKTFTTKGSKSGLNTNKAYGNLINNSSATDVKEMPTALDAIRKMVTDSCSEIDSSFEQQTTTVISNPAVIPSTSEIFCSPVFTSISFCYSISSTTPHGAAASPAFSDISDDAPTLEKEVADKGEERPFDRIKELVNSKTPLEQLSLSIENEKMVSGSKSGVSSSSILCPVTTSTTTIAATLSVPRASSETNQSCFSDGSKKSETKLQSQPNTIGSFTSSFLDPSFAGLRHPSALPISVSNLPSAPSPSVFAQPYFMPFMSPSVSNAITPGLSQPHLKHKIHDLKANAPNLIASHSKDNSNICQSSSVTTSSSHSVSQGGPGNIPTAKQAMHQPGSQNVPSGNSFGLPTLVTNNGDRSANAQNVQASALNYMQQQQQQAYFAHLQQHQQLQYMQRFGTAFPITGPPNSMNAAAQAYEQQMAALHASFGYPGIFMPPSFPPK
ncbi:unnamed protein product [Thelazia callipaeda]|uniref:C2H2-type domain-containing protein n=1 Tax=Thelazia callipaeda TaxID=103827 RepID=A0A158RBL2_THECL|nr:unnamed protein product [Thelazia callipaeda]